MSMLRDQIDIALGSILAFVGLAALAIAFIRRRQEDRILMWFGLFTGIYAGRMFLHIAARQPGISAPTSRGLENAIDIISYLFIVVACLFWLELSLGALRRFIRISILLGLVIAVAGISSTLFSDSRRAVMPFNQALAICLTLVLMTIAAVPRLSRRFLVVPGRVPAFGAFVLAAAAIYVNLSGLLSLPRFDGIEPPAFAIFIFSLGYAAAQKVLTNERRLLSIENELEIARGIQDSILPASAPELEHARIAAAYLPMTSVAGDFYEFIVVDRHRAGFLVADVSGHGVPAALIASMIKIAMQSVVDGANDPGAVLRGLNRVLSSQMKGQFVTAAYLWMDTEARTARYSAAGHPPLLWWRAAVGDLQRIESNGLLFGLFPDSEYPVCDLTLAAGDRLLLYTDGLVEAENGSGEAFGDRRLEELLRAHHTQPAAEVSACLVAELRDWQPKGVLQQDDVTLVVADVL